jgi:hypothetical protein
MLSRPPAEPANTVGRMQQRHARSVWRALAERSNDVRDLTLMVQTVILQLIRSLHGASDSASDAASDGRGWPVRDASMH